MTQKKRGSVNPRFKIGDKVRVKPGISDPLFPELPLAGWAGTVTEIIKSHGQINCLFKLDDRTLASMHTIYRKRCDRDGLDFEIMSLYEEELELDDGVLVPIEQPTEIKTPPLSELDQADRVRMVFGLTHDDPIPFVSPETLTTYYRYLAANLKFPFFSFIWTKSGSFSRKKVMVPISRLDPPVEAEFHEEAGLYGIGFHQDEEIEFPLEVMDLKKQDPNYRLIDDHTYWSHTWRAD